MSDETLPPFLPPEYLQAIGNLAAYWAYLESSVEVAIWCFLNRRREIGGMITADMGMISRINLLTSLAEAKFKSHPELAAPLKELLKRIDPARISRNNIIHNLWKYDNAATGKALGIIIKAKSGPLQERRRDYSVEEIEAVAEEAWDITSEMMGLLEVMFPNRKLPWQRTPPSLD